MANPKLVNGAWCLYLIAYPDTRKYQLKVGKSQSVIRREVNLGTGEPHPASSIILVQYSNGIEKKEEELKKEFRNIADRPKYVINPKRERFAVSKTREVELYDIIDRLFFHSSSRMWKLTNPRAYPDFSMGAFRVCDKMPTLKELFNP